MGYIIAILTSAFGGLIFFLYNHPDHGRKLMNYVFPAILVIGFAIFIFTVGYVNGMNDGHADCVDCGKEFSKRGGLSGTLYATSAIMMFGGLFIWQLLEWLSRLFEDAKKQKNKTNPDKS